MTAGTAADATQRTGQTWIRRARKTYQAPGGGEEEDWRDGEKVDCAATGERETAGERPAGTGDAQVRGLNLSYSFTAAWTPGTSVLAPCVITSTRFKV